MVTIIDRQVPPTEDVGVGTILGVILAILVVVLFFVYGLPALRGADDGNRDINVNLDTTDSGRVSGGTADGSGAQ